ncbi:hypothetical protein GGE45_003572 [Rhizobium aethiopicum]|uniref:Uncharacterized protein n=1 Tax=Rhizobium aethiopicum TaxID=1138170 RepID=A0A7W6VQA1_9HYPH|nr:hypothetical protein [Rhizobium aethiopicum]MBB4194051.1 hypothetical protein [Rhizobium aethiopicum]MBB4581228.1 hypothetical protein [Rhizobium aethiopicum]
MTATVQQRQQARAAILHWHRSLRSSRPRCEAKRKHDGQPCQQLALENGKCAYHGGRTPRADGWHKPRWPNVKAPNAEAKLNRKLKDREKAAKKRAARLAAMTADERAKHDSWHRAHQPGPPGPRERHRQERHQAEAARRSIEAIRPAAVDAEAEDLGRRIADLERELESLCTVHDIFG